MAGAALEEHLAAACRIARQRRAVSGGHGRGRGDGWRCSMGVADCAGDDRGDDKSEQIGRASCRARVCQYGWISVVARILNKNIIKLHVQTPPPVYYHAQS